MKPSQAIANIGVALALLSQVAYTQDRALLIGCCSKYQYLKEKKPLQGTKNDAFKMKEILIGRGLSPQAIDYLVESNATYTNIIKKLKAMEYSDLASGDTLYMFYSGHGTSTGDQSSFGKRLSRDAEVVKFLDSSAGFIPYDFNPKDIRHTLLITKRDFRPTFEKLDRRGVNVVWIADACYTGNGYRSVGDKSKFIYLDKNALAAAMASVKYKKTKKLNYRHLLFYGASLSSLPTREIDYRGERRGEFSVAVQKCLTQTKYRGEVITNGAFKKCLTINHINNNFQPAFYPQSTIRDRQPLIKSISHSITRIKSQNFREKLFALNNDKPLLQVNIRSQSSDNEVIKTFCNREMLSIDVVNKPIEHYIIAVTMDKNGRVIMLEPNRRGRVIETQVKEPFGNDRVKIFATTNKDIVNMAETYFHRKGGILSGAMIEKLYNALKSDSHYRTANITLKTIAKDIDICKKGDR